MTTTNNTLNQKCNDAVKSLSVIGKELLCITPEDVCTLEGLLKAAFYFGVSAGAMEKSLPKGNNI